MSEAKFIQKKGPDQGKIYPLSPSRLTLIGRLVSNNIQLAGKGVSRKHCQVEAKDNAFIIRDLGSTNKILVNGNIVSEHKLSEGDEITIGEYVLTFTLSAEKEKKKKAPLTVLTETVMIDEDAQTVINQTLSEKDAIYTAPLHIKVGKTNYEDVCRNLSILCNAGKVINAEYELDKMLEKLLDMVFQVTKSGRCVIYLRKDKTEELIQAAIRIRESKNKDNSEQISLSRTITGRVLKHQEAVLCTNAAADSRFNKAQSMIMLGGRSVICAPLKSGQKIIGLLYVDILSKEGIFSSDDLQLLAAIGNQAGAAINNALLYKNLEEQKQLNEDIVENIDEGIVVVDNQRSIIFTNSRLEELTGYRLRRTDLFGKKISEVFSYLEDLDKNFEDVFNSGETLAFEGGALRYTLIPVKDPKGRVQKIVTVLSRV